MNLQELDKLIEKYFQGSASEKEEKRLIDLVSAGQIPAEYKEDIALIKGLTNSSQIPEPDRDFEARIMEAIDSSVEKSRIVSLKRKVYTAVSIAASILIIITSYLMLGSGSEPEDTFSDPVLAYNATVEVFGMLGQALNQGSEVISELSIISTAEDKLVKLSEPARLATREMESLKYIDQSIDILTPGAGKKE